MKNKTAWLMAALLVLFIAFSIWSCSEDNNPAAPAGESLRADCIGCHTNETMLKAVALPDTAPAGDPSGEG